MPRGIAVACVHFKQAKDLDAPSVRAHQETTKGTALEQFTTKLKTLLMDEGKLPEENAAELIKANTHLVGLGALGGDAALEPTAFAIIQTLGVAGAVGFGANRELMHPASRVPLVPGGEVIISNQPLAGGPGTRAVGGGEMARGVGVAGIDAGADRPSQLQEATAKAEDAEIAAAADGKVNQGKGKASRK